jgi:hypothetical protein
MKPKKKVDYEALHSPFMRIPRMIAPVARDFLDLELRQVYELRGRAPEALFADACRRRPGIPEDHLHYYRMAVYFAETETPDPARMHPSAWAG